MKYLKTYENVIKHSDPISLNHPLRDFSRKLEDILINIGNSFIIRRYFINDGSISIHIKTTSIMLFKIGLRVDKDKFYIRIMKYPHRRDNIGLQFDGFFEFVSDFSKIKKIGDNPLEFTCSISEQNNLIDYIELYNNVRKFNL